MSFVSLTLAVTYRRTACFTLNDPHTLLRYFWKNTNPKTLPDQIPIKQQFFFLHVRRTNCFLSPAALPELKSCLEHLFSMVGLVPGSWLGKLLGKFVKTRKW